MPKEKRVALSTAVRSQRRRDKKKAEGLVKVEVHCKPKQVSVVKELEQRLRGE